MSNDVSEILPSEWCAGILALSILTNLCQFQLLHRPDSDDSDPKNNSILTFEEEYGFEDDGEHEPAQNEEPEPQQDEDEHVKKARLKTLEETRKATLAKLLERDPQNHWTGIYDLETRNPTSTANAIDGVWVGRLGLSGDEWGATMSMGLITRSDNNFTGEAEIFSNQAVVTGTVKDERQVDFTIAWFGGMQCSGVYDPETLTIKGSYFYKEDASTSWPFTFRRTPAAAFRFRHENLELTDRQRWVFAIEATKADIRRAKFPWKHLKEHSAERRRYIELYMRHEMRARDLTPVTPLTNAEGQELRKLSEVLRPCDARFYTSVVNFEMQKLPLHGCFCNGCASTIHGPRWFCTQCMDEISYNRVDLSMCMNCREQTPQWESFVHQCCHLQLEGDHMAGTTPVSNSELILCTCCGEPVAPPCLVCIFCDNTGDKTHLCKDCLTCPELPPTTSPNEAKKHKLFYPSCLPLTREEKEAKARKDATSTSNHNLSHPLVFVFDTSPASEVLSTDVRITILEAKMTDRIQTLEQKIHERMQALEEKFERFHSLETILHSIADKLQVQVGVEN
ncbi:hypothetical protein GGX14DRAFT_389714 [Mycena pura]|uniref:Uncharacterized protein n=1 Tax=Mycena pura TaxID=153505 RepID=A0AAD6VUQ7_9AGAR|nr:hypothetical protein GGX14DRAFT_389714 [Mycena pura]